MLSPETAERYQTLADAELANATELVALAEYNNKLVYSTTKLREV